MDFDNLNASYQGLINSSVGKHLIEWIKDQRDSSLRKAEKALDMQEAYGLTKNAHAYTVVLTHLDLMSQKLSGDGSNVANPS